MVYVIGILGFISGFVLGLRILGYLLRDRSREDLLSDKGLRMSYGLLTWAIAGFCSYGAIVLFRYYFPVTP